MNFESRGPASQRRGAPAEVVAFEESFHGIVECGPNRNTTERIIVRLNMSSVPTRELI